MIFCSLSPAAVEELVNLYGLELLIKNEILLITQDKQAQEKIICHLVFFAILSYSRLI